MLPFISAVIVNSSLVAASQAKKIKTYGTIRSTHGKAALLRSQITRGSLGVLIGQFRSWEELALVHWVGLVFETAGLHFLAPSTNNATLRCSSRTVALQEVSQPTANVTLALLISLPSCCILSLFPTTAYSTLEVID